MTENKKTLSMEEFSAMMFRLRAHYQNSVQDPKIWAASVVTYFERFRERDGRAIAKAFDIAWKKHKDWMPSAGQFDELVAVAEKEIEAALPPSRQIASDITTDPAEARQRLQEIIGKITEDKSLP